MQNQMKIFSLVMVGFLLQACSVKNSKPQITGSGFSSTALAGGSPTASPGTAPSPTPPLIEVQEMRIADESDGKKYLEVIDPSSADKTWQKVGEVQILPTGTQLHHWGSAADIQYWAANGIKEEDIDRSRDNPDQSDRMGGGFYLSTDPIDSSTYGSNCLIAEIKQPVAIAKVQQEKFRYHSSPTTYIYNQKLSIAPAKLAQLGIDGLLYTNTWLVSITARPLANLFEASWPNFIKNYAEKNHQSFIAMVFALHYEVTSSVAAAKGFQEAFPSLSEYFSSGTLSEVTAQRLASELLASTEHFSFQPPVGTPLSHLKTLIFSRAEKIMADGLVSGTIDDDTRSKYFSRMNSLHIRLSDLSPLFKSYVPPADISDRDQKLIKVIPSSSNERLELKDEFAIEGFYKALSKLVSGSLQHKFLDQQKQIGKNWQSVSDLLSVAKTFDAKASYRDLPAMVTGDVLLDGPGTEGYLEVSEDAKNTLQQATWIVATVKSQVGSDGTTKWFAKYERPSIANYNHFLNRLPLLLQFKIRAAAGSGNSIDPASPEGRALTVEIIEQILSSNYVNDLSIFEQVGAFANKATERFVLSFLESTKGDYMLFPTSDILLGVSKSEMRELSYQSYNYANVFDRYYVDSTNPRDEKVDFDLEHDIGIWEITSNIFDVKNPAEFVGAVKKRFEQNDVQEWITNDEDIKVLSALHEAGEGL